MNFDLTREQAQALSRAVHLVMENLLVTVTERKALNDAQQSLYKALGIEQVLAPSVTQQTHALFEKEKRGLIMYDTDEEYPFIIITVDLHKHEDVEVVMSYDHCNVSPERDDISEEDAPLDEMFPYTEYVRYLFPCWYGARVHVTIYTLTGKKEASYLVTKEGIEETSESIQFEILFNGKLVVKEPA